MWFRDSLHNASHRPTHTVFPSLNVAELPPVLPDGGPVSWDEGWRVHGQTTVVHWWLQPGPGHTHRNGTWWLVNPLAASCFHDCMSFISGRVLLPNYWIKGIDLSVLCTYIYFILSMHAGWICPSFFIDWWTCFVCETYHWLNLKCQQNDRLCFWSPECAHADRDRQTETDRQLYTQPQAGRQQQTDRYTHRHKKCL